MDRGFRDTVIGLSPWQAWPGQTVLERFADLDVSLSSTAICVVDDQGYLAFESSVAIDPDAVAAVLVPHAPSCVGLEAMAVTGDVQPGCCHGAFPLAASRCSRFSASAV
jgi:hypothetical protein